MSTGAASGLPNIASASGESQRTTGVPSQEEWHRTREEQTGADLYRHQVQSSDATGNAKYASVDHSESTALAPSQLLQQPPSQPVAGLNLHDGATSQKDVGNPSRAEAEARVGTPSPPLPLSPHHHRHRRREKEKSDEETDRASIRAKSNRRRVIPRPPHRQLFLVNGYYCGVDPLQQNKAILQNARTRARAGDSRRGLPAAERSDASLHTATLNSGTGPQAHPANTQFYVSPTAPQAYQFSAQNQEAGGGDATVLLNKGDHRHCGPGGCDAAQRDAADDCQRVGRHAKRRYIRQRFYEPVELQVESFSFLMARGMLLFWYSCLIAALVLSVLPGAQWTMHNICGKEYPVDMRYLDHWTSDCVSITISNDTVSPTATLAWQASAIDSSKSNLDRFRRIVLSIPTPATQSAAVAVYDIAVLAGSPGDANVVQWTMLYPISLRCDKGKKRCDTARVSEDFFLHDEAASLRTFTLVSVPLSMAEEAKEAAIGVAYQRAGYTLATVIWRYALLLFSLLHTIRFIANRKYTSTLYEQSWVVVLQIALFWYLDPIYALNIVTTPLPAVLAYIEFRLPTYFMSILVAYMLSVMTASMAWTQRPKVSPSDGTLARIKAFLLRTRSVYDPPMWTKFAVLLYVMATLVLDLIDACVGDFDWLTEANSTDRVRSVFWAVLALLFAGGLLCVVLLFYLRSYLGNKPYLESRPQQLACRVFLMFFLSVVVFYITQGFVFFFYYNGDYSGLVSQQPFIQLPSVIVASVFVNVMTLVYTSQSRDENVPIHPRDPRWKHMVWPDTWYRWLARNGGSQYIFATEAEEASFYRLQFEFRWRQLLAKQKRHGTMEATMNDLMEATTGGRTSAAMSPLHRRSGGFLPSQWTGGRNMSLNAAIATWSQSVARPHDSSSLATASPSEDRSDRRSDGNHPQRGGTASPLMVSHDADRAARSGLRQTSMTWGTRREQRSRSPAGFCSAATTSVSQPLTAIGDGGDGGSPLGYQGSYILRSGMLNRRGRDQLLSMSGSGGGSGWALPDATNASRANAATKQIMKMDHFSASFLHDTSGDRDTPDYLPRESSNNSLFASLRYNGPSVTFSPSAECSGLLLHGESDGVEGPARRRFRTAMEMAELSHQRHSRFLHHSSGGGGLGVSRSSDQALRMNQTFSGSSAKKILGSSSVPRSPHHVFTRAFSDGDIQEERRRSPRITRVDCPSAYCVADAATTDAISRAPSLAWSGVGDATSRSTYKFALPTAMAGGGLTTRAVHNDSFSHHHDAFLGAVRQLNEATEEDHRRMNIERSSSQSSSSSSTTSTPSSTSLPIDSMEQSRHRRNFIHTLSMARAKLGNWMSSAERNLVERPARNLDRLERNIVDAAYRPFQSMQYLPFFNLETAIDCFNVSWEAYGVVESAGDTAIETGIKITPQNVPKTVAHGVKKYLFGCCPADDEEEEEEEDGELEERRDADSVGTCHDSITTENVEIQQQRPSTDDTENFESGGPPSTALPTAIHAKEDMEVVQQVGGEASPVSSQSAALSPSNKEDGAEPREASVPISPPDTTPVAIDSSTLPIDVEKYGFIRLLVAEAKEVQVLMVKMDTNAPEHRGKAPRIVIGFRGTANISNAKYDLNIHRIVWREMEREEANPDTDATSTIGGSTSARGYLGCASCLKSCIRKTSWRPTCHAGFLAIWKALKPTVTARLREVLLEDPSISYRIFTTGHSLGGALASLCAYTVTNMLRRMDYPIPEVTAYTYGQPRMGNRTFRRIYNNTVPRSFRVVNESDVVVTMTMFGGYHVGIEVDVDRNGNFIVKPTEIEKLFPPTKGRGMAVVNHLMLNYGVSLNAIACRASCPARGGERYLTAEPAQPEGGDKAAERNADAH